MSSVASRILYSFIHAVGISFLCRKINLKNAPVVVLFHSLSETDAKLTFSCLSKMYSFISIDQLLDAIERKTFSELPRNSVVVTFDDGRKDNLLLVDLLKERVPAINYVSTSAERRDGERFISRYEILKLADAFIIGAHTHSHPDMTTLEFSLQHEEVRRNIDELKHELGQEIVHFAYPFGCYNDLTIEAVKANGLRSAMTVDYGRVRISDGPYRIRRICISNNPTEQELIVKLSGALGVFYWLKRFFIRRKFGS